MIRSLCSSCSETSPFGKARGRFAAHNWLRAASCERKRGAAATGTRSAAHQNELKTTESQSAGSLFQMML